MAAIDGGHEFSPSDFMRSRRPELFSDAVASVQIPPIDRAVFEFHLNTLTSRKEEIRFEHFCRRLAEKEICPNLLPQTGPTGGGDSKVDSETYPVDASIALRWYHGAQQAASERWAFAFSAKKEWRPKVRSDVEKIVGTDRGYTKIFFMTNQAVSDKKRALLEDELRASSGADVRILDRTWITEKVFANERWDVVYQTLDLERPSSEPSAISGPLDTQRHLELQELDDQIANSARYMGSDYQLVEDCIQTALLARALGAGRIELEGRFDRAERLARDRNDDVQLFRVHYNRVWTAYWWFDDLDAVDRSYAETESLVLNSEAVWHLEKLVNLWQIGIVASAAKADSAEDSRWDERSQRLLDALEMHAKDSTRATSALWAQTEQCLMQFTLAALADETAAPILKTLHTIVERAEGLLDYPFGAVVQIVREMGSILGNHPEFDELFEAVMTLNSARTSQGEEGRLRIERGRQKLDAGDHYGAISQFARAQMLLAHEEHLEEFMLALAGTALGYDAVGLSWAARGSLVLGLDRSLYEYQRSGEVAPHAIPLLRKLVWLELQLGRVPCALLWIDMLNVLTPAVQLSEEYLEALREEHTFIEAVVCILILRTRPEDWPDLGRVPEYLESLHLPMARGAALFALGHEELFRSEFELPEEEDVDEFFGLLLQQPAARDVPRIAEWHTGERVVLETSLLGCRVRLDADNNPVTLAWGETILAFLEAFFSTVLAREGTIAMRPELRIRLEPSNTPTSPPLRSDTEEDDCGETWIRILHSSGEIAASAQDGQFHDGFVELLAKTFALLQLPGAENWLESYLSEERAQDRAGVAAQSILSLSNVLGEEPDYHMGLQIGESIIECLEYIRDERWEAPVVDLPGRSESRRPDEDRAVTASGFRSQRHKDIETFSIIDLPLWDAARWRGTLFLTSPDPDALPALALLFENGEPATKIIKSWLRKFGPVDRDEYISVSIITGVDAKNPASYRIAISSRIPDEPQPDGRPRYIVNAMRFQEMTPSSSANLDRFLDAYACQKGYSLGAACDPESPEVLEPMIGKRTLDVVPAWSIGPNTLLVSALKDVDDPVVPADQEDAPVWGALKQLAEFDRRDEE